MARPRLLDVTRLASRAGLLPTGVDRVELAYLRALTADHDAAVFGLCRTALGYVLLDRDGLIAFGQAWQSRVFDRPDILSRLNQRLTTAQRLGQSFVRRRAIARARAHRLDRLLARLSGPVTYVNVGHSNLTDRMLHTVAARPGSHIAVLIHDTIPLDFPDMQRPKTVAQFHRKLTAALCHADTLICATDAIAHDLQRHAGPLAKPLPVVVAPLGVDPIVPAPEDIPIGLMPLRPYFMVVGTIEPRKNHAMLLDIWDDWGTDAPDLLICGRRGWLNHDVFAQLDDGIPHVIEAPDLTDGAIAALLQSSQGLLFPSLAEGYGLPPIEAAGLGVPVICSDLAACREVLGDWPVYLKPANRYDWEEEIKTLLHTAPDGRNEKRALPNWKSHFEVLLSLIG